MAGSENFMLNTSVMCGVMQLLLWPKKCQGGVALGFCSQNGVRC